jgi:colanic acid/amylovoran biosynthesis glycosyltransferase
MLKAVGVENGLGPSPKAEGHVLIYRNELLPLSETFIQAQAAALRRFRPQFVGMRRSVRSLPMPSDSIVCADHGLLPKVRGLDHALGFRRMFSANLDQQLKATQASLVHAHFGLDATTAMSLADRVAAPLIVTLHGYDVTMRDQTFRRSIGGTIYLLRRKQLWRHARLFICVSHFIRRKALEAGFPEEKLRVHYIGVDRRAFCRAGRIGRSEIILFVGRLVEKKGCEYLIRAMAQVRREHPDAQLVILGDGPLRQSLQELCDQLGVNCKFEGRQSRDGVIRWLRAARVLCVPSVTATTGDSEALGMVFAEAQASGTPVVSSKHGGIPEVVIDGETGLLAPERDAAALANGLSRLLADDDLWQQYSDRGVDWIARRFDLETQTRELEQIYSEVTSYPSKSEYVTGSAGSRSLHRPKR